MNHISIRDLQKISGATIGALPGPTAVKSGDRTVALLVPLKAADPDRLAAVLARAEALAMGRDPMADDAALAPYGEVDPVDWSLEAVQALMAERAWVCSTLTPCAKAGAAQRYPVPGSPAASEPRA